MSPFRPREPEDETEATRISGDRPQSRTASRTQDASSSETQPAADARPEIVAGDCLGAYRVLRMLGKGGMGEVYEAEQIGSGRRVALKVLHRSLGGGEDAKRFLREGRLAASVTHPNSVYVFGSDEIDGVATIAMELVAGGTLDQLIKRDGPLPPARAVDAVLQMAAGLEAAAAVGVLHRDIKPSNCFVDAAGDVKIGDYGLSMSTMSAPNQTQLTMLGTFLGTPAYASPEQVSAGQVDVRSDIYSVGATLYFLLTGRPPFVTDGVMQMLAAVLREEPDSPRKHAAAVPEPLADVVLTCLAKDPSDRYSDYARLRSALQPFGSQPIEAAPLSLRWASYLVDFAILMPIEFGLESLAPRSLGTVIERSIDVAYFSICEGLWGWSAGKRLFGLQVVAPGLPAPGIGRAAVRAIVLGVFAAAPDAIKFVYRRWSGVAATDPSIGWLSASVAALAFTILFSSARKRSGLRGLHELASGTRVIRAAGTAAQIRPEAPATRDWTPVEIAVGRYICRERAWAAGGEELLAGADPSLGRDVWIHRVPPETPRLSVARQNIARATRLRVIDSVRVGGDAFDVYEAPDGGPLPASQPWRGVRQWLPDLCHEVAVAQADGTIPAIAADRVWITSAGGVRLLDFQLSGTPLESRRPANVAEAQTIVGSILSGVLPRDEAMPMSASDLVDTLQRGAYPTLAAMHGAAVHAAASAIAIGPMRRGAVLAGPGVLFTLVVVILGVANYNAYRTPDLRRLSLLTSRVTALSAEAIRAKKANDPAAPDLVARRDALLLYMGERYGAMIVDKSTWAGPLNIQVKQGGEEARQAAMAASPEARRAAAVTAAGEVRAIEQKAEQRSALVVAWQTASFAACMFLGIAGVIGTALAPVFRAPVAVRLVGGTVVTRNGRAAGRGRAGLRTAIAWSPALVGAAFVLLTRRIDSLDLVRAVVASTAVVVTLASTGLALGGVISLPDRLAGTRIVPL